MNKKNNGKSVYRSRYDWWLVLCLVGAWIVVVAGCIGMSWWVWIVGPGMLSALYVVCFAGMWYEIKGNDLYVYMFFRPMRLPVGKIKSIRKAKGFLASAAGSTHRVSITFKDRTVLKSYAPLEISPKDMDAFIDELKSINPEIEILN